MASPNGSLFHGLVFKDAAVKDAVVKDAVVTHDLKQSPDSVSQGSVGSIEGVSNDVFMKTVNAVHIVENIFGPFGEYIYFVADDVVDTFSTALAWAIVICGSDTTGEAMKGGAATEQEVSVLKDAIEDVVGRQNEDIDAKIRDGKTYKKDVKHRTKYEAKIVNKDVPYTDHNKVQVNGSHFELQMFANRVADLCSNTGPFVLVDGENYFQGWKYKEDYPVNKKFSDAFNDIKLAYPVGRHVLVVKYVCKDDDVLDKPKCEERNIEGVNAYKLSESRNATLWNVCKMFSPNCRSTNKKQKHEAHKERQEKYEIDDVLLLATAIYISSKQKNVVIESHDKYKWVNAYINEDVPGKEYISFCNKLGANVWENTQVPYYCRPIVEEIPVPLEYIAPAYVPPPPPTPPPPARPNPFSFSFSAKEFTPSPPKPSPTPPQEGGATRTVLVQSALALVVFACSLVPR